MERCFVHFFPLGILQVTVTCYVVAKTRTMLHCGVHWYFDYLVLFFKKVKV